MSFTADRGKSTRVPWREMREPHGPHDPDGEGMAAMLVACPSFKDAWGRHLADWAEDEGRGPYLDVAEFARYLVQLLEALPLALVTEISQNAPSHASIGPNARPRPSLVRASHRNRTDGVDAGPMTSQMEGFGRCDAHPGGTPRRRHGDAERRVDVGANDRWRGQPTRATTSASTATAANSRVR